MCFMFGLMVTQTGTRQEQTTYCTNNFSDLSSSFPFMVMLLKYHLSCFLSKITLAIAMEVASLTWPGLRLTSFPAFQCNCFQSKNPVLRCAPPTPSTKQKTLCFLVSHFIVLYSTHLFGLKKIPNLLFHHPLLKGDDIASHGCIAYGNI